MRLDVLIPTFNRAELLGRTLDSLLAAKVPPGMSVAITVINNNCTDHTEATVAARAKRDDRVRQIVERKQGRSPALNAGITATTGDLVGIVDDDEEVDATWFEAIARAFTDPDLDYIGGPYIPNWEAPPPEWLPPEYGGVVGWIDGGDREVPYDSSYQGILMGGNAVFRRRVFDKVGLYATNLGRTAKGLLTGEDREFYDRLLASGMKGQYLPHLIIHHWVPRERCTRKYFRSWMFWHGVSMSVYQKEKREGRTILGVPRWRYRRSAAALFRAFGGKVGKRMAPSRVFVEEMQLWEFAGLLYGATVFRPE